jgi:hypothetical protein
LSQKQQGVIDVRRLVRTGSAGLACATVAFVLYAAAGSPAAQATYPGENGVVVYATTRGDLWAFGEGGQRQLTTSGGDSDPAFSPDGDELAFQRDLGIRSQVFLMNADGTNQRELTEGSSPDFAPDGARIVFTRRDGVYTMVLPSGSAKRLLAGSGYRDPRWSTGGIVAVERTGVDSRRSAREIDIAQDGKRPFRLAWGALPPHTWPAWSPTGRRLYLSGCLGTSGRPAPPPRLTRRRLPFAVSIVYSTLCAATVPSPDGTRVEIAATSEDLYGEFNTTCPEIGEVSAGEMSWQPLESTTRVVPISECVRRSLATGPPPPPSGTRICRIVRRHHHVRRLCARV